MHYALNIGMRYLRSKKRSALSIITLVAVTGVALGVGALLAVLSITSGFQDEFRAKVLGVNAHVLVQKYGIDFEEYRDVIRRVNDYQEVAGAAPFVINEMMLAKGDRLSGVLVKGIDVELTPTVLDLPSQMRTGSLDGLRRANAAPPLRPEDLLDPSPGDEADLDRYLEALARRVEDGGVAAAAIGPGEGEGGDAEASLEGEGSDEEALVDDHVPSPAEAEAALAALGDAPDLPSDADEARLFEEETPTQEARELPGIIVGFTLAETLGLAVGDRVSLVSPTAGLDTSLWRPRNDEAPRSRDFRVIGVFQAGFQEYDSRLTYVDIYEAQGFLGHGDTVDGVEIRLHDLTRAPELAKTLERSLGGGPYRTTDWRRLNEPLFQALENQKLLLSLVIATIIFVAAFNVIATLIMVVLEKKREIAILKAMGAPDGAVLTIFVIQGALVGLLGTLIGLVLGGAVCFYLERYQLPLDPKVYLIDHLPVRSSPAEFVVTVVVAFGICLVATLLPSWWAARLLPADGVRYE